MATMTAMQYMAMMDEVFDLIMAESHNIQNPHNGGFDITEDEVHQYLDEWEESSSDQAPSLEGFKAWLTEER